MKHFAFIILFFIASNSILRSQDTIKVEVGWNMVGDISKWYLNEIRSEPTGIISSSFFAYSSIGYTATDTLNKGKGYWVKTTQAGILIWETSSEFLCGTSTVTYSGKTYNTVQIGSQCWLKENLDVGTMITGSAEPGDNSTIEKYCYDNNPANCTTYGGLYQWKEAMQYSTVSGARGICPTGWHIPTYAQQQALATAVSNNGNALKAIGQGTGGGAGTNTSGFSALLSGYRYDDGTFINLAFTTYFWSSTEYDYLRAFILFLGYDDSNLYVNNTGHKIWGFSVRCLKD